MPHPSGKAGGFPTTAVSQVLAVRSTEPAVRAAALRILAHAYLGPVYKYTRLKWHKGEDEARDITQSFFATALEQDTFAAYEPAKARFRTFLRVCLDRFISNDNRARRAQKRGGDLQFAPLDFDAVEREVARAPAAALPSAEDYFHQEWLRELTRASVEALREELAAKQKFVHFHVFERLDLTDDEGARPAYADLAAELGLSVTDVTNRLTYARRAFRRVVLQKLRELTATEEEFEEEAKALLGVEGA